MRNERADADLSAGTRRRVRFSVLSADADDTEVADFIQRLTESDDAFAARRAANAQPLPPSSPDADDGQQ